MTTPITEELIFETLRLVIDPELGCNIVDLGLVYSARTKMELMTDAAPVPRHKGRLIFVHNAFPRLDS